MTVTRVREWQAELVVDAGAELGEGPSWHAGENRLLWVDILGSRVHRYDPASGEDDVIPTGRHVGAVVPTTVPGTYAVALRDGLGLVESSTGAVVLRTDVHGDDEGIRFNDGKCDPDGRFVAGTMRYDVAAGAGALYRFDADGSAHRLLSDVTISNGLAWSADGTTLWFIDTGHDRVDRFRYDGELHDREVAVDLSGEAGSPDGMTIDEEGLLWVARWDGGQVVRCTADGRVVGRIPLPCDRVTSVCFGGDDLADLYITTARYGLDEAALAKQPQAGGLFVCRPGVRGTPTVPYRLG